MKMDDSNKINYTHHVFKLIKQFDINLYQQLLVYFKKYDEYKLSKYLFGQYKNKYKDPILEIVKHTNVEYPKEELNNVSYVSSLRWNVFLFETCICHCNYNYDQLLKLNKIFWEDNILFQYTKENNIEKYE